MALLGLSLATPAHATRGLQLGFADPLFQSSSDRGPWLDASRAEGASVVKLFVTWGAIARQQPLQPRDPADPAYSFAGLDDSVQAARARGLDVLIGVQGAPRWAEGAHRPSSAPAGSWKPQPGALGDFMAALALRYSGTYPDGHGGELPLVRDFQIWNEPNLPTYLTPQWKGKRPVAAQHYKRMLNASYDAIHSVRGGDRVVTAGLAPYGGDAGSDRTRPLRFWREDFCLQGRKLRASKRCPGKARFDVFAHHAINTSGPPKQSALDPDDASSGDLPALRRIVRAAERRHTVGGKRRHPLWATEMWWESSPPSKRGYSLAKQARYIQETMYLIWRAGFSKAIQLRVRDSPFNDNPSSRTADGLYFIDGSPKPSVRAFRFPFVAERTRHGRVELWGKAPQAGRVAIQRRRGKRWKTITRLKAGPSRVFDQKVRIKGRAQLRARAGSEKSVTWRL